MLSADLMYDIYDELTLTYSISHPVKTHIDCLRAFLFYGFCSDVNSASIVAHDNGGRLRVAKIGENSS
jgi:hypothetical protein